MSDQSTTLPILSPASQHSRTTSGGKGSSRDSTVKPAKSADIHRAVCKNDTTDGQKILVCREGSTEVLRPNDKDTAAPFRFLDLHPELRNIIYEKLLHFEKKALTCHPQILRTCKQIHGEATGFLYGDNALTINVHWDRVEVHGVRCGPYNPLGVCDPASKLPEHSTSMASIVWPDFVARMWTITVAAPGPIWHIDSPGWWPVSDQRRTAAVNNVFYSLCLLLRASPTYRGSRCQALATQCGKEQSPSIEEYRRACYPARLLGSEHLSRTRKGRVLNEVIYLCDSIAFHHATMLRNVALAPKAAFVLRIVATQNRILRSLPRLKQVHVIAGKIAWIASLVEGVANRVGVLSDKRIEWILARLIVWARDLTVSGFCDNRPELLKELHEIILVDIELQAPRKA